MCKKLHTYFDRYVDILVMGSIDVPMLNFWHKLPFMDYIFFFFFKNKKSFNLEIDAATALFSIDSHWIFYSFQNCIFAQLEFNYLKCFTKHKFKLKKSYEQATQSRFFAQLERRYFYKSNWKFSFSREELFEIHKV